jgi:hypothetical protein
MIETLINGFGHLLSTLVSPLIIIKMISRLSV